MKVKLSEKDSQNISRVAFYLVAMLCCVSAMSNLTFTTPWWKIVMYTFILYISSRAYCRFWYAQRLACTRIVLNAIREKTNGTP